MEAQFAAEPLKGLRQQRVQDVARQTQRGGRQTMDGRPPAAQNKQGRMRLDGPGHAQRSEQTQPRQDREPLPADEFAAHAMPGIASRPPKS